MDLKWSLNDFFKNPQPLKQPADVIKKLKTSLDPHVVQKNWDSIEYYPKMNGSCKTICWCIEWSLSIGLQSFLWCNMEQDKLIWEYLTLVNRIHSYCDSFCVHQLALHDCVKDPGQFVHCVLQLNNKITGGGKCLFNEFFISFDWSPFMFCLICDLLNLLFSTDSLWIALGNHHDKSRRNAG